MRRVVFAAALLGSSLILVPTPTRASLYAPDEPYAIPVGTDGKATPLPFPEFKRRLVVLTNALLEPKKGEKDNPDREPFLKRVADRKKVAKLAAPEAAALAVDLLRVGKADDALNLLGPRTADRRPDYFVFSALGHIHAARGEWAEALRYHQEGQLDTKMPAEVKGLSKQQRDWWEKLDAEYVPHYYRVRKDEADARAGMTPAEREKADANEEPLPLFPLPGDGGAKPPVKFVNDKGEYQPGALAAAEKAKLPADAIAAVQQMLFWTPSDTRLYWLLGELYAASGDLSAARAVLVSCVDDRKHGNRKALMAHRHVVMAADDARPKPVAPEDVALGQPEAPPPGPQETPISMKTVLIYFGVIGLLAAFALVRTIARRARGGNCGPVG